MAKLQAHRSVFSDLEPWIVDSISRLKLRGSRLEDAEPGLLGMVAGSGLDWFEGWGVGQTNGGA